MNKFEFTKVMDCLATSPEEDGSYIIDGCRFYHDGYKYFARVYGDISREFATNLFEKYDNSKYKIRVEGTNEFAKPVGNVHIYHVDTIQGLAALILELRYFDIKNVTEEQLEERLQMIYRKILSDIDTDVSVNEWMLDRETRKKYFNTMFEHNTLLDLKLRKKLIEFDNITNPYSNEEVNISNNKFVVNGNKCNGETNCSLTDKETGIILYTGKNIDGFVTKLFIPSEDSEMTIYHYYDIRGEKIAFEKYDYSKNVSRIEYDITHDTFGELYVENHPVTVEDKKLVIKKLDEYIKIAEEIVKKNTMSKSINGIAITKRKK